MFKLKKILCFFITIMLLFTLSACGKSKTSTDLKDTGTETANAGGSTDSNNSTGTSDTSNAASDGDVADVLSKFLTVDNYTYSATSSIEGQETIKFKAAVKGKKMKFETTTNGITAAIYYDLEGKVMYTYDPESKAAMKVEFPGEDTVKGSDLQYNFHKTDFSGAKKTGTEKIAGKDCTVYEYVFGNEKSRICIWEEYGILLKIASYENDKVTSETTFDFYEVGNVTDEMVTLPKDAQIMELKF